MSEKYVYVIQHKITMIIYGCFDSYEKAEPFTNKNQNFHILKLKVI